MPHGEFNAEKESGLTPSASVHAYPRNAHGQPDISSPFDVKPGRPDQSRPVILQPPQQVVSYLA